MAATLASEGRLSEKPFCRLLPWGANWIVLNPKPAVKYHPEAGMTDAKGVLVEFPASGGSARGYLSKPSTGTGPGVLVLQEWWGLVGHIRNVADRFAAEGYVALAPDLYHGESTQSPDEAGKLMMALDIERAEKDLRAAGEYLVSQSSGEKLGVVGFCMGGQLALFAACQNPTIGACVDFYGIHPKVEPDYSRLSAPVLGLFAEQDEFVSPEVVTRLEASLEKAGVATDFHIYPGVDHAFFNDERPAVYDESAASDAWRRVLEFFEKHLGRSGA